MMRNGPSSSPASDVHPADAAGFAAIGRVRPILAALMRAGDAIVFPPRTLLHAGPPYAPGQRPPAPVANSAAAAVVFEGWASDRSQALALIEAGEIRLAAAQDHRCVVPLASVLSPSQQVQVVRDAGGVAPAAFAPLNGGSGPALRLGLPGPQVVAHLRWLNGPFADAIRDACGRGIELLPLADQALAMGDDCHGRTQAGTAVLLERLSLDRANANDGADTSVGIGIAQDFLAGSPSFFLNLWMAAVKCMLGAAEGTAESAVVTAMGANGIDAGLRLASQPDSWHRCAASVPVGVKAPEFRQVQALPAVGDSGVVEAFGLGAMAFAHSPLQQQALGAFMPESAAALARALLSGPHPGLRASEAWFGLSARAAITQRKTPAVVLGMLDASGRHGRIGAGIWHAPASLFSEAAGAAGIHSSPR